MSAKIRPASPSVIEQLEQAPAGFEFFQAVRLLQQHFRAQTAAPSSLLGEKIRFASSTSLAFPLAEIAGMAKSRHETAAAVEADILFSSSQPEVAPVRVETVYTITPNVMGLTGPMGALPNVYSQYLQDQSVRHRHEDARAFLDVFNNRLVSLFVKSHFELNLTHAYAIQSRPRYARVIQSLTLHTIHRATSTTSPAVAGLEKNEPATLGLPEEFLLAFSGLFRQRMASAQSLEQILSGFLQVPVAVHQFVPEWFWFNEDETSCLGQQNTILGTSVFVGEKTRQVSSCINVVIGPVPQQVYNRLLPAGDLYAALQSLLIQICPPSVSVVLKPVLHRDDVRPLQLGQTGQLGQQTFLLTRPSAVHRQELSLACGWLAA